MDTVKTWSDIRLNILQLEKYKNSENSKERIFYKDIIRRGRCFVALDTRNGFVFAPSRFVGYVANDIENHDENYNKDGRITNVEIDNILGTHDVNKILEEKFKIFCQNLDINPDNHERKYWNLSLL